MNNKKLVAPISVIASLLCLFSGIWYMSSSTKPFTPTASGSTYTQSGKTADDTLAACVRGDTFTFHCMGGIQLADGRLILNSARYRDDSNVSVVVPKGLLTMKPDQLKGRLVIAKGTQGDYKGKPQWLASEVTVK